MRAIGYARVSTTKQDLARQRCKITNFCGENGYELEFIIEDFGISGATLDRKGYQKLNSLTEKDCDMIVVSEISRLSRKEQITEALNDIQQILNNGISVILLDDSAKVYKAKENLNISELLLLIIQLWGAAQERNEIKRKNQDGKQALFKSNPYAVVDAKIPFGFKKVPNTMSNRPKYLLEQNPTEVEVVKKIFELVLDGKTLYGVMQYLNDRNIMIRKGMPSIPILSFIIHSELYIGIRKRKQSYGTLIDAKTEDEISPEKANEYIAIVDGQHRFTAAMESELGEDNLYLFECLCDSNTKELIASTNIDSNPWDSKDYIYGAIMFNPNNELAQAANKMADAGYPISTIGLILYFDAGKMGKKDLSNIIQGKDGKEGYDLERAEYFLEKAHKRFDDAFIGKKYLISAVKDLSIKKGYEKVCDAIPKLSDNQVKRIQDAKSDDKISIIKTALINHLDK